MKVSDKVLRRELEGIREITMLYPGARTVRSLVDRSEVQKNFSAVQGLNAFLPSAGPYTADFCCLHVPSRLVLMGY